MPFAQLEAASVQLSLAAAGLFFLTGLLTGVWKYAHMAASPQAQTPTYVDIAHRAALFYSFAALLIAAFAALSAWPETINFWAATAPLAFFALAIGAYVLHGLLGDTDNQFRRPHRVGPMPLPRHALLLFMVALSLAEIGGFLVLFAGLLRRFGWI